MLVLSIHSATLAAHSKWVVKAFHSQQKLNETETLHLTTVVVWKRRRFSALECRRYKIQAPMFLHNWYRFPFIVSEREIEGSDNSSSAAAACYLCPAVGPTQKRLWIGLKLTASCCIQFLRIKDCFFFYFWGCILAGLYKTLGLLFFIMTFNAFYLDATVYS